MEDNLQTIIGAILSVFILFIFPIYMAYEKKDDVSYALAMRYTEDFANDVRNRGYITSEMLETYKAKLLSTGNSYEINLTHKQTRLDPITNYYKDVGDGKLTLVKTAAQEDAKAYEKEILEYAYNNESIDVWPWSGEATKREFLDLVYKQNYEATGGHIYQERIDKVVHTYLVSEEVYTTKHIEDVLATENKFWPEATTENFICIDDNGTEDLDAATKKVNGCKAIYTMNQDDYFNVAIKNTNITPATAIYNMITANTVDENTRIFVNYGGTIINEKWSGKIDYTKAKHDNFNMEGLEEHQNFNIPTNAKAYIVEFEAKPWETTELREKGYTVAYEERTLYNVAVGGKKNNEALSISVGLNGIALVHGGINSSKVILAHPMAISGFKTIRVKVQKTETNSSQYIAILYVDGVRIGESMVLNSMPKVTTEGSGYIRSYNSSFEGEIKNLRIFY